MVYNNLSQLDFSLQDLPQMPQPTRVLMTTPAHFDVQYVINPYMEGNIGNIDTNEAHAQWQALADTFDGIGLHVHTIGGAENQPDMVFCANQTLPFLRPDGSKGVILSNMHAEQRKKEVPHYQQFFALQGYETLALPQHLNTDFEGMGDALWHPNRRLIWGGHGFRTDTKVYDFVSEVTGAPVIALALHDPHFYHLDTCMSVLDEKTVLIEPKAFQPEGLALIHHVFERVIEAPSDEAINFFAVNAHCPDGKHVVIQRGCTETCAQLEAAGFTTIEVETTEFLKSGGSVFCMKMMYW
jgi:N-dimethylarginine dimethylaminohydrolase